MDAVHAGPASNIPEYRKAFSLASEHPLRRVVSRRITRDNGRGSFYARSIERH